MASSTSCASSSNSVPATGLNLSSTCTQCSFATLPSAPENFCVSTAYSRLAPSAWLDDVRIFSGQFGQVRPLFSCSGGAAMISSCVTDSAPCRHEVHGIVDAVELAAGNRQVARGFRAAGQGHRIVFFDQLARVGPAAADVA